MKNYFFLIALLLIVTPAIAAEPILRDDLETKVDDIYFRQSQTTEETKMLNAKIESSFYQIGKNTIMLGILFGIMSLISIAAMLTLMQSHLKVMTELFKEELVSAKYKIHPELKTQSSTETKVKDSTPTQPYSKTLPKVEDTPAKQVKNLALEKPKSEVISAKPVQKKPIAKPNPAPKPVAKPKFIPVIEPKVETEVEPEPELETEVEEEPEPQKKTGFPNPFEGFFKRKPPEATA